MYIIFDETIIDSEEIKDLIQQKSDFKVEKDMCKATKREDVLAYLVTLDVDLIEKQIREEYDLQDMEMEDLFEEYMELAKEKVSALPDTKNFKSASIIETEPYGYTEQGKFLNTVYSIETLDTPAEFLDKLHQIENEAERKREIHWGPRTLDLDILLYDDLVTEDEEITIPHPELTKRLFVLEPLCELAPRGIHPLERRRYSDILEDLKEKEK